MLFYFVYIILFNPLFFILINIFKLFNAKINIALKNQKQTLHNVENVVNKIDREKFTILLFHAASSGEFEQIKPLLKRINRNKYFIIQSFTSPTVYMQEMNNQLFDIACYQPFDLLLSSYKYFSKIQPDKYIITRHDLWPIHVLILSYLKIPIYYINANVHSKSIWLHPFGKLVANSVLCKIKLFLVPSQRIKNKLIKLVNNSNIIVTGDSRFNQIIDRFKFNKDVDLFPELLNSFNIIFGSYDMFDEKLILKSIKKKYPKGDQSLKDKNHNIILVPHEIHEKSIANLIINLTQVGFNPLLYSKYERSDIKVNNNIIIVNKIGILAELYKYAKIAYVGSGFGRGVHSVIEPAVYGCAIAFGPNFGLLDEAKDLIKNKSCLIIKNQNNMDNFLNLNNHLDQISTLGKGAKNFMNQNLDIANTILNYILK